MPDPLLILSAMGVAFAASGVLLGLFAWPRRRRPAGTILFDAGWVLAIGLGFVLGCWMLGVRPHWPPRDDQDRFLTLVLPAVVAIELLAAFPRAPRWLIWPLRLVVVAGAARVLLHGTSYITDLSGPGTSEWPPTVAWLVFGGLAELAALVWALLALLACRAPGPSLPVCLAIASAGAAVTVMFSGYASAGGQVGLALASALMGATATALVLTRPSRATGPLGVALVALFSLLVVGRFFGELSTAHAIALFCAPLLGWLTELPYVCRLPSWARGLARVTVVATVVSVVVVSAQRKFDQDFKLPSGANPNEPSVQVYMNFGK